MPLRLRRGTNTQRLAITPLEGELIYTTDSKQVFVGDGSTAGGISLISSTGGTLENNLSLNGNEITGVGNIVINGTISNGTLVFEDNKILSQDSFIAVGSGNSIDRLQLGANSDPTQIIRPFSEAVEPLDITYGITNGFFSLVTNKNVSRGTVASPTIVQAGDCLSYDRVFAYDGLDYVTSSAIWHGIDPAATPQIGLTPGAIALITEGITGQNILSFDSRGYLGINKFPSPAMEALDVTGNGLFSGSVTANGFIGSVYAPDSTLMVDTDLMVLSNGTIIINDNKILSDLKFNSSFTGNPIGTLLIGDSNNPVQIQHYFNEPVDAYYSVYGIAGGFTGLANNFYSSNGTFVSPLSLVQADTIHTLNCFGHDGTSFSYSCGIRFGVDVDNSVSTGIVPGNILFLTTKPDGSIAQSGFNAEGYFGINTDGAPASTNLDVWGDALIRGTLSNNTLTFNSDRIFSNNTFNSTFTGNPIGTLLIGERTDPVQIQHYFNEPVDSYYSVYGIAGGFTGLANNFYSSNGTFVSPTTLVQADTIHTLNCFGHDGTSYNFSCGIRFGVDVDNSVSTGIVPGNILFLTTKPDGSIAQSGFNAEGYFGINTGGAPAETNLDVWGDALIRGTATALAYKGTFVADDSTLIIDGATSNVVANNLYAASITSPFVTGGAILLTGSTIVTTDSSDLTVNQATTFLSDVTVEGRITAAEFGSTAIGTPEISSATDLKLSAGSAVVIENAPFRLARLTTTERDALLAANGDIIYNTTLNKFQGYENGSWVNLI